MHGLSIVVRDTGGASVFEQKRGFKGFSFRTDNRQFIEVKTGFKGLSIATAARGQAIKISRK